MRIPTTLLLAIAFRLVRQAQYITGNSGNSVNDGTVSQQQTYADSVQSQNQAYGQTPPPPLVLAVVATPQVLMYPVSKPMFLVTPLFPWDHIKLGSRRSMAP